MKFDQALKAMREGKRVNAPSLSPNCFYLINNHFFVYDGMAELPIYGIKDEYLLAEDWEVVDD